METGKLQPNVTKDASWSSLDPVKKLESAVFSPTVKIDYVVDLTREYHNLLQKCESGHTQTYLWDGNVAGMLEEGTTDGSYYLQDEMGSPIRLVDETGTVREDYGYDEFGQDLYGNQGEIQPFGYTGYQYDAIAGTYFAQAREYRAGEGRFGGEDILVYSRQKDTLSWNRYVYCKQNPTYYVDLNGHESIVVSGGPADTDTFDYQFVETALKNIYDMIEKGIPVEDITWMVTTAGYTETDLVNFANTASKIGINYVEIPDKEAMIEYINEKDGGTTRAEDLITQMTFFSHGQSPKYAEVKENQLSFAYNIEGVDSSKINFTQSDIAKLEPDAFENTVTVFYSCNAGTKDGAGNSFAQTWSNQTGGLAFGIENGRTFYGMINVAASWGLYNGLEGKFKIDIAPMEYVHYALSLFIGDSLWDEKHKRSEDREIRGYSEYGSMNYPWLVSLAGDLDVLIPGKKFGLFSRGWKMYFPEKCELED